MRKEEKKPRSRFSKIARITAVVLLGLLLLSGTAGFVIIRFYSDEIKQLFVREINKKLRSEVSVKDISFTVFRQFPYATVRFSGIKALDATEHAKKGVLLEASELNLGFSILDLYRGNYRIRRIDLSEGRMNIRIYRGLEDNYHFWKEDSTAAAGRLSFRLDKVMLNAMELTYDNRASGQNFRALAEEVVLKGSFSEERHIMSVRGALLVHGIKIGSEVYVREKMADVDLDLEVDNAANSYTFKTGGITLGGFAFRAGGTITTGEGPGIIDLSLDAEETSLQKLIPELPENLREQIKDYEIEGLATVRLTVKGSLSGKRMPAYKLSFGLRQGKLLRKAENIAIEDLSFNGSLLIEEGKRLVRFRELSARLREGSLKGELSLEGEKDPLLTAKLTANADLAALHAFLKPEAVFLLEGRAEAVIDFQARIHTAGPFTSEDLLAARLSGKAIVSGMKLQQKQDGPVLENASMTLALDEDNVELSGFTATFKGNNVRLDGYFSNFLPWLLRKDEPLRLNATLSAALTDLDKLTAGGGERKGEAFVPALLPGLTADLDFRTNKLVFGRFTATTVKTRIRYASGRLWLRDLSFDAFGGKIEALGSIDASGPDKLPVHFKSGLTNVDINRMFTELNNFGQDYVVADNLRGRADGKAEVSFLMDRQLNIDPNTILATLELTIEQGELINYKTIQGLGKFIRVDDLSHVRFSKLHNEILIRDGVIHIPDMEVNSDALNFFMSGSHSFSGVIDYRFRVRLSEILWKKARQAKKENEEFGIEEEDGKGKTSIFVSLTGTVSKPVFRYDLGSVRRKMRGDMQTERQVVRDLIREEFRARDTAKLLEREDIRKQEEGRFLIEWEGERTDSSKLRKPEPAKSAKKTDKSRFRVEWDPDKPVM